MKTIYFIRHGQSAGNASLLVQQTGDTQLTRRGIAQAKEVARHLKDLPIEAIISSTYARAKATAAELGTATGLLVEHVELFRERRRPGVQIRRRKAHPSWLWTQLQLMLFGRRAGYRHSDEENVDDLLARANQALALLAARPEAVIAVFTHGTFMRSLYAAMTYGEGVTGRTYLAATRHMRIRNTALMVAEHDGTAWSVRIWNADAREVVPTLGKEGTLPA
jgi:broad specificity phosphatase PhoE